MISGDSTNTCSCSGTCTGWAAGYDSNAMNRIVFGRDGNNSCGDSTDYYYTGMCDVFWRVGPTNVVVTYTGSPAAAGGLNTFVGRPTPIATITVELQNLPFQYFFLSGLLGFANRNIPAQATTITSEVLSSAPP